MSLRSSIAPLGAVLALAAPPTLFAVDGVLLIDQGCVAQGCFAGDSPGFPVEIARPGSYRLSGNLGLPDLNTTGIRVLAPDVHIDLNGFGIFGKAVCSGAPPVCQGSGLGSGVEIGLLNSFSGYSIRNGSIRGMGYAGLFLNRSTAVEGLVVDWNAGTGISCRGECRIIGNIVNSNEGQGISASGLIADNSVSNNNGPGIEVPNGLKGCVIRDNTLVGNWGAGIITGGLRGEYLIGCAVLSNGVNQSSGPGLVLGLIDGYALNVLTENNSGGAQATGGTQLGSNLCNASLCP